MKLSKRLEMIASLVPEGSIPADIGTDHGYIPIYLIENQIAARAIALDINKGPLERVRMHIVGHGLKGQIETRLSDGLKEVKPGEVDTMIAAGMGGALTIRILENSPEIVASIREFILQPQSEIHKVREYLSRHDFCLVAEDMIEEDGKYYPIMKLVHGKESEYSREELYYGRILLEERHPVLYQFLKREESLKEQICRGLAGQEGERALLRRREIEEEIAGVRRALAVYQM